MRLFANKELNTILESDARRSLIRPLIDITREQIDSYVEENRLSFIEDPTNIDTGFVRNRVRHEVIPMLRERFDPSIVWILSERARSLAADVAALDSLASECLEVLAPLELGSSIWLERCCCELSSQPDAIKWRVVQGLLLPLVGFTVGEDKALAIVRSLLNGVAGAVQLSKDLRLRIVPGAGKRRNIGGVFLEGLS
jgi:tRNA(Ile)-lysidine synthase